MTNTYRGKYPNKIKEVSSQGKGATVTVNNGKRYTVKPLTTWGRNHMPVVGAFIHDLALSEQYSIEED